MPGPQIVAGMFTDETLGLLPYKRFTGQSEATLFHSQSGFSQSLKNPQNVAKENEKERGPPLIICSQEDCTQRTKVL